MKTKISLENGITVETDINVNISDRDDNIDIEQFKSFITIFKDRIKTTGYSSIEIDAICNKLKFSIGTMTKNLLTSIGQIETKSFVLPNSLNLVKMTFDWRENYSSKEDKDKFIVIESDKGDFTLVDKFDNIFVYSSKTKTVINDKSDVITHIAKHVMRAVAGEEKY